VLPRGSTGPGLLAFHYPAVCSASPLTSFRPDAKHVFTSSPSIEDVCTPTLTSEFKYHGNLITDDPLQNDDTGSGAKYFALKNLNHSANSLPSVDRRENDVANYLI
jgi:hypothetical protein